MTYRGMFFMYRGILFFLIVSLSAACQSKKSEDKEMPNILFLLADDLGYGELGVYGQGVIKTPVLDELAENAMRFTNFYAGNSVCSPSRAVLMTGVGSSHNTIRGNEGWFENVGNFDRVALKNSDVTIAEMLREASYETAFVGKWHLMHQSKQMEFHFSLC